MNIGSATSSTLQFEGLEELVMTLIGNPRNGRLRKYNILPAPQLKLLSLSSLMITSYNIVKKLVMLDPWTFNLTLKITQNKNGNVLQHEKRALG